MIWRSYNDSDGTLHRYSKEVMYWTGYVYRYWHYYTGESSRKIYKIADEKMMNESWLGFHTLDVEMAIDDLKEIYNQKHTEGGKQAALYGMD